MKSRIVAYDFDNTLFNSPIPEVGRIKYQEMTGVKYPHRGWWSRHESLNPPVVPLLPDDEWYRSEIIKNYMNDIIRDDTMTVLITGRMCKFETRILQILSHKKIRFDQYHFSDKRDLQGNNTLQIKCQKIYNIVKPHHASLEIWDDRSDQIDVYREFFNHYLKKTSLEKIVLHNAVDMSQEIIM